MTVVQAAIVMCLVMASLLAIAAWDYDDDDS